MIKFANAKINLGLAIHRKRTDGFHELSSILLPIPLYDVVEIVPADSFQLTIVGLTIEGNIEDNLITRGFRLLEKECSVPPVHVVLKKNIPMGAGLGGGSADVAFFLVAMNNYFSLGLSSDQLKKMSAKLGSDCPFFIENVPQLAEGRGEILTKVNLDLTPYWLHLVCPDVHISTQQAYSGVVPMEKLGIEQDWLTAPIQDWKTVVHNDFEDSLFPKYPILQEIKEKMYCNGAIYSAMSGSGSTIFGLFEKQPSALDNVKGSQFVLDLSTPIEQ